MTQQPCLYESHSHTPLCKHAAGTPGEYAAVAEKRGLKGLIVTCHSPMPDGYSASARMSVEQFPIYCEMVDAAAEEWRGRVDVLLGLESDYYPGCEGWLESLHGKASFNYILGSVHPHIKAYQERFFTGDNAAFQKLYFSHLAMAAETGLFDALAHPDLIKNLTPKCWDVEAILDHIKRCLDRIAKTGVAMELNTSGANKPYPEMNPSPTILREMRAREIPVVLGADAHDPTRVGDRFEEALALVQASGYSSVSAFRGRSRYEVPVEEALASLVAPELL